MAEWIEDSLNNIVKIIGGGTPKTSREEFWNGNIPWLSVVDFNDDSRWVDKTEKTITQEGLENSSTKLLEAGDIIISARGTVGALAQLKSPMTFNQSCYGIRGKDGMNNGFLFYLIKYHLDNFKRNVHGAVFDTITRETFNLINVRIPDDHDEQQRIYIILDSLDRKISLLRRQNEILEEMAQALFRHWFIDFEFPISKEYAESIGKPELEGKPYRSSGGKMILVDWEYGEIPKKWKVQKIGEFVEVKGGGTPSTKVDEYWNNGSIDWYSPTDLTKEKRIFTSNSEKKITDEGLKNSSAKLLKPYSILLTSRATIGEMTIITRQASTNQGFINIEPKSHQQLYYTFLWTKHIMPLIISKANGSTFLEISKGNFKSLPILKMEEETMFEFSNRIAPLMKKIEVNLEQIDKLVNLRDILLPKLMSGEVSI